MARLERAWLRQWQSPFLQKGPEVVAHEGNARKSRMVWVVLTR